MIDWLKIGARVICVDNGGRRHIDMNGITFPEVGPIYVVRKIQVPTHSGGVVILLEGIINPICPDVGMEYGFNSCRFRPVIETKTDISIFERMLDPITAVARERA
jgi:hypothetical protein